MKAHALTVAVSLVSLALLLSRLVTAQNPQPSQQPGILAVQNEQGRLATLPPNAIEGMTAIRQDQNNSAVVSWP